MGSNVSSMPEGETILSMIGQIDRGNPILDLELECKQAIAAAMELGKASSVTLTIAFKPDPQTEAMTVSAKVTSKIPKETRKPSLFFVTEDFLLTRTHPNQRDMFVDDVALPRQYRD